MEKLSNFQRLKLNLILLDKDVSYGYKDFLKQLKSKDDVLRKGENK